MCLSWQVPVPCTCSMFLGCHPLTSPWMYGSYGWPYLPVPLQRDPHAAPGLQSSAGEDDGKTGRAQLTGGQRRLLQGTNIS